MDPQKVEMDIWEQLESQRIIHCVVSLFGLSDYKLEFQKKKSSAWLKKYSNFMISELTEFVGYVYGTFQFLHLGFDGT